MGVCQHTNHAYLANRSPVQPISLPKVGYLHEALLTGRPFSNGQNKRKDVRFRLEQQNLCDKGNHC
jgi:hypothetical protein